MSDLEFVVENILGEDDDVDIEKEQDTMDRTEFSVKNPANKIPEPSLGEAIALLREAIKLHTTQNIGLGNKSKVYSALSLTADPGSYSTNSVKLVADPAKSCCSSNNISNLSTADSGILCDTNSGTQCSNENSEEDYLNDISLEYENIKRKRPPLKEKLTNIFQNLIWFSKSEQMRIF